MRANERLANLLRRIAEGTWRATRPRAPTTPARRGGTPAPYLPRRHGWLGLAAGFQMRNVASQLQSLLAAPQTHATIAAAPPQARLALARALKTPCRLLGVDLPPILTQAGHLARRANDLPRPPHAQNSPRSVPSSPTSAPQSAPGNPSTADNPTHALIVTISKLIPTPLANRRRMPHVAPSEGPT